MCLPLIPFLGPSCREQAMEDPQAEFVQMLMDRLPFLQLEQQEQQSLQGAASLQLMR